MKYVKYIALALLAMSFGVLTSAASAHAQEEVCIAVYPCLDNGDIDPLYDVAGFCGDKWRAQCSVVKSGIISEQLNSCHEENASLVTQVEKLTAELKKQQRAIRKLKQANARK